MPVYQITRTRMVTEVATIPAPNAELARQVVEGRAEFGGVFPPVWTECKAEVLSTQVLEVR